LNQTTYIDGDLVTANVFRFANLSSTDIAAEIKIWLGVPGIAPISVTNVGADGSVVLPAGVDIDSGPISLFPVTGLPLGNYELSCRMLDPVTGELLVEDLNPFEIQTANTYAIGDTGPAGGIVFHVTDGGLHGLEAAPVDQQPPFPMPGVPWGCHGLTISGADGTAIGTGAQNTVDILSACSDLGIAARLADSYTLNGFTDWYLPSKDELNELYLQRALVGNFTSNGNGYWSSTEMFDVGAWFQDFDDGSMHILDRNGTTGVRAIRSF
jgi:hypothetical protein